AGVWQTGKGLLQAWRNEMSRDPGRFEKMRRALEKSDLRLATEHALSGMPRGYQNYADEPISPWLKLTSFIVHQKLAPRDCTRPNLVDRIVKFALSAKSLFEYAWAVESVLATVATDP